MAAPVCCLRTVLSQCHRHILKQAGYVSPSLTCTKRSWTTIRFYAAPAAKASKNVKEDKSKAQNEIKEEIEQKRKDKSRPKPYGLTAWEPTDDVYIARYYSKPTYEVENAVDMLKKFQQLDFTYPNQPVYAELKLDMKLEKKKKVDPFVGYLNYPYPFVTEENKILVFTENAEAAEIAKNCGAAFVGGVDIVQQVLEDEIQADFYVATPEILPKLNTLKNKLRKKFPKSKRGSVGRDIRGMVQLFKTCHEYLVEKECLIKTKIATLNMPREQITANLDAFIKDTCKHRPLSFGPFVERAIISSATSEGLLLKFERFLPQDPQTALEN
ncbi:large ribosomal subunit protein uL1m [Pelodytes ibericus]